VRQAHAPRRTVTALGILLACCPHVSGLNPSLDINQYAHTAWTVRDGFFKGAINTIAQTPDGYLWLGTEFGLFRFDGVRSVLWTPPAKEHLPSGNIAKLLVSRDGRLWIGTATGLASWKDGSLTHYPELAGQLVVELLEDRQGTMWASGLRMSAGRLCAIRSIGTRCYGDDGSLGVGVTSLYEYRGDLWAGAATGLWSWKLDPPKFHPIPGPARDILALIEGDNGALWIAMRGGIRQLVDGKAEPYPLPAAGPFNPSRLLRDREGGLWIGTSGQGLVHLHQGKTDVFASADGLSGEFITSLFQDREGNIWVGTLDGLDRFRDLAVPTISFKQGLSSANVASVLAARDGSVWLGTSEGLNRWNDGQITIYRRRSGHSPPRAAQQRTVREINDNGLPDSTIQSIFEDDQGRIWIWTLRGIAYFQEGRFTPVSSVPRELVYSVAAESAGNLWINDQDQGLLHLLNGKLVERIPWATLGRKDNATASAPDRAQGGLWLGFFQGGVAYFRDGRVRASYRGADGLGEGRVSGLQFDRDGALWAATQGGLSRMKNGRAATLTSKNGLPCDGVHWMMEDDAHSVWLGMECGVARIARSELDAWSADPNHSIQDTFFDISDGVRSQLATTFYSPSVAKAADGKLWFVTRGGVSVIDPRELALNKLPPPVHIEHITAGDKKSEPSSHLRLPALVRDVSIEYTALSFVAPEKVRFRYKLEGQDPGWTEVVNQRQVHYSNLRPRHYRFRVTASNNSGVWNETGASLDFSVAAAYYQTRWFQAGCAAGFLVLLWALYRLRVHQLGREFNMRVEERVGERTRIARELHDTLLQSLAGVSLQLDGISKQAATAPERMSSLIAHVREQVDYCFREARIKVWNLRSPSLEGQGLAAALREFVERVGPTTKARCEFTVSGGLRPCSPEVEEELLRIAQEAANNANRHAQASEIRIALEYSVNSLTLSVSDDGRGFDFEEGYRKSGHWGLKNIEERTAQIRGISKITTAVGRGTKIEVHVPLSSWSLRNTRAKHAHSSSGGG
jgi:signal transduction histidine kinase/ligand-binding sensor domain-containing protein